MVLMGATLANEASADMPPKKMVRSNQQGSNKVESGGPVLPTPAVLPTPDKEGGTPEEKQPVAQKPDYTEQKDFGDTAIRAFGVTKKSTLENFLKNTLGVTDLNQISGSGLDKKLDATVQLSESTGKLQDNLMTGTMLGVLGLVDGKRLKDATVEMEGKGSDDTALKIKIGEWEALAIKKASDSGSAGQFVGSSKLATDSATEVNKALDTLGATEEVVNFFNGFTKIGLLVGDELKDV